MTTRHNTPICEGCGEEIKSPITFDAWIFATIYDPKEEWEVKKTGEEATEEIGRDYIVFGECCIEKVKLAWRKFVHATTVEF